MVFQKWYNRSTIPEILVDSTRFPNRHANDLDYNLPG
jgi:hypothetical protein